MRSPRRADGRQREDGERVAPEDTGHRWDEDAASGGRDTCPSHHLARQRLGASAQLETKQVCKLHVNKTTTPKLTKVKNIKNQHVNQQREFSTTSLCHPEVRGHPWSRECPAWAVGCCLGRVRRPRTVRASVLEEETPLTIRRPQLRSPAGTGGRGPLWPTDQAGMRSRLGRLR